MNSIGALIAPFSKGLGLEEAVRLEHVRKEWTELVGATLSTHICPAGLKNGELLIFADSPAWLQQITFFKTDILRKLAPFNVKEVRFRLGRIISNKPGSVRSEQPQVKSLSSEEKSFIEDVVSVIKDPELRECIKKTVEKSMQIQPVSHIRE